jgi:UTP-glucose-1-phosphate uridylyltransferase
MGKKIKKAVFPVAGLGTRFLPVTKVNPKEMLPVVDKPLVQYAAEEAVAGKYCLGVSPVSTFASRRPSVWDMRLLAPSRL